MSDDKNIIDVEEVQIAEMGNLPAVIGDGDASNSEGVKLPNRQDALLEANAERRCVAHRSNGDRCRKFAIYGSTVCRTHGGATKRVKEKARVRVENASNRLMGKLIDFAFDDTKPPDIQLRAIRDALDRSGLKPPSEVVLSQGETKPYEDVFDAIGGTPPDESHCLPTGYGSGGIGATHSPASAYADTDCGSQAEAGEGVTDYSISGYDHLHTGYGPDYEDSDSSAQRFESSRDESPPTPGRRDIDRDTRQQRPTRHITGEDAIRLANEANRQIGALPPLRELENRPRRYP